MTTSEMSIDEMEARMMARIQDVEARVLQKMARSRIFSQTDVLQAFARVYCTPPWDKLVLDASFGEALVRELGL
jgi:hypothetical protein